MVSALVVVPARTVAARACSVAALACSEEVNSAGGADAVAGMSHPIGVIRWAYTITLSL